MKIRKTRKEVEMTRFIHDQFAKDYLEEFLKPYGEVKAPIYQLSTINYQLSTIIGFIF